MRRRSRSRCRSRRRSLGYYPQPQRASGLTCVAVQYLNAPTGFWRLCDANNAMVAGALAARPLIGDPDRRERDPS